MRNSNLEQRMNESSETKSSSLLHPMFQIGVSHQETIGFQSQGKNECLETKSTSLLHPLFQIGVSRQETIGFLS